ncbi:MAG: T9SS type A sorting domain-containing protein [Candidatus Cloacimonetes bacterium]|nr:T9SS type A sorting domain-containing protein [Candidatus Cloacimonadota bacterium]
MKYITIIIMLISVAFLAADPIYYPTTTVIENFGASWCGACEYALQGLDAMQSELSPGEVIISRLLTESGEYSNAQVDSRFDYYTVMGLPAVIFNGKVRVDGASDDTIYGLDYLDALSNFRYLGSPLKMTVQGFNVSSGAFSVLTQMVHDTFALDDADLVFYLVEDDITTELTHIVRSVETQPILLSGAGSQVLSQASFSIDPTWNTANLWAFAFVQLPSHSILQGVSTLPLPQHYIRAAVSFDHDIQNATPGLYLSPSFLIYNMGNANDVTMRIETISAPENWYLNYCDEDGGCYPGFMDIPFSYAAGEAKPFHLNIDASGDGTAVFNLVVESPQIGIYKIPFTYTLGPISNNDPLASPALITLGSSYPNPFVSEVNFELTSHKSGLSSALEIYNIKGQKLQEVPLQNLQIGVNSINWKAENLPNGLYLYRLKGTQQSGKLLKVR